jgi:hypothetical protein
MRIKKTKREESLQIAVSRYLKLQYTDVIFTSESSGIKLTIGQAVKAKAMRSSACKLPDMIILEPRGEYHGLILELKREGEKIFKADGTPYSGHIYEQFKTLQRLKEKGYYSSFAIGFDDAKRQIDFYMKLPKTKIIIESDIL